MTSARRLIALFGRSVRFAPATTLVVEHALRSLDALHLAVVRSAAADLAAGAPVALVTRDHRQAAAAAALGMTVE